jgi:tetratricopeptide (TPR) repeat protein
MMLQKYTWVYTDNQNKEWLRGEALLHILKTKKITAWVYVIFNNKFSITIINTIYSYIARNRLCLSKEGLSKKPSASLIKKAVIIILLLSSLVCIYYRQTLLYKAGNFFFGGKFYNITLAKTFFILANKSNDTKIIWLNYQMSRIYFIEGNLDQALTYANKEVRYHPENCRTYYIRGLTFGYLDRLDAAIEDFEIHASLTAGRGTTTLHGSIFVKET